MAMPVPSRIATALLTLAILGGCKLSAAPGAGAAAPMLELTRLPGLSRLHLELATAPAFASLLVTAYSASTMKTPRVESLSADELARRRQAGEPVMDHLPRAGDMVVRAYLRGPDAVLLAAGEVAGVAIGKGDNRLGLGLRPAETPRLLAGSDGVDVSDGVVIKGITVVASTGLPDGLPGVARVDLALGGPAYGDGREVVEVATFQAPAIRQYAWRPAAASKNFLPERLGHQTEQLPFTLTAKAFDEFGNMVGQTHLPLAIVGTAFVDVGFDPGTDGP